MDLNTYDQFSLSEEIVGEAGKYLVEGGELDALVFDEQPIAIELKSTVELKVTETSPGVRGDTATGGNKAAVLESGLQVNVPLFINEGDKIKINTETGEYMTRV
ncbi:MAG: elongation factor P [Candidatus Peregrinibacteria bacterium Greene1014_49]|nr:MAG: elongation factor P [Candidatus Peregrinibacteria bacterium Greene1014_49]